ncbi:MAG TPA: hypothetical protein VF556_09035 [Pyrinomonadaceae bacterium]
MNNKFIKLVLQAGFFTAILFTFGLTANAQKGISLVQVVKFEKGSSLKVVNGSVKRGVGNDFLFTAHRGQNASFYLEGSAGVKFTLMSPDGKIMTLDKTDWTGELPANGVYRVNVLPDTSTNRAKLYKLTMRISQQLN